MRKTKFIFLLSEDEIKSRKGKTALVYNWDKKILQYGGSVKCEMEIRDIIKLFFGPLKVSHTNPRTIVHYGMGLGRERRNWKIVFTAPCLNYVFKMAYRRMMEARARGGIKFMEAYTIGRIFN